MKIDPYHVTKRWVFEAAGAFHAVTKSLNESLAVAHANTARKLAGKNDAWDSPADALVAKSTVHRLKEALHRWEEASEEVVPLTAPNASLSGRASVMVDAASGLVVASESQRRDESREAGAETDRKRVR